MTSHASVSVMLALENEFDVEFPDSELRRASFQTIDAIIGVLAKLGVSDSH
jgi:acyl carrier protein